MRNSSAASKPHRNRRSRPMLRKSALLSAATVLVLGLVACKHDPAIIDYPTPMSNLKQAPRDSAKEDKQSAAQTHTQLAVAYMGQNNLKDAETALKKIGRAHV